jgi:hypothetical protein
MIAHIVLSYDLGLKGDYANLYRILDEFQAIECGNNVAAVALEVTETDFDTIYSSVQQLISHRVAISSTDRIYLITKDSVDEKMKGKFLFGNRRRAPWEGYFTGAHEETDVF